MVFPRSLLALSLLVTLVPATSRAEREPEERSGRRPDDPKARAAFNAEIRRDARGILSSENRLKALRQACELPTDPSMRRAPAGTYSRSDTGPSAPNAAGTKWQPIGPQPIHSYSYPSFDPGTVSGRITAVAVHPTNAQTILVGGATGGIWRSTDGGLSWAPVSDNAPSLATSQIAFSKANPSIVYAATGEADSADLEFRPSRSVGSYLGAGLLRSVDGGATWTRVDTNLPSGAVVSRVVPHPTNPSLVALGVYVVPDVAADGVKPGGFWRSTDGGVTFTKTFDHAVSDLAPDPNAADGLFAAFGLSGGCATCTKASGVYQSADFGLTFTPLLTSATAGLALPEQTANVKLGIAATNPATLYASVLGPDKDDHDAGGIFRSGDGGATWVRRTADSCMCPATPSGACFNQCSYDHFIVPAPGRPDTVWFGSIGVFKSTDGAVTWEKIVDPYGVGGTVHPDQHAGGVVAGAADTLLLGNDGGLYRTTDGGATWDNLNASLSLTQFNGIALHPTDPTIASGGAQDVGNLLFSNSLVWTDWTGGDGGFNLIHQSQPNRFLSAYFYASLNYSTDGGQSFADVTPIGTLMTSGNSPKETMLFYPPATAAPSSPDTVFIGTKRVWANPVFGSDASQWTARSTTFLANAISALAVAGDGNGPMWAGVTTGHVYFSTDGGATFLERPAGLPATYVTKIVIGSADGRTAYVTFGGFTGTPSKHVFRTTDAGASWTNLSADLPDVPMTALAIHPTDPNDLYVATDVGVFRSTNGGASWASFNDGLPNTTVTDLQFHRVSHDLVASTYGRGAFRISATGAGGLPPVADFGAAPVAPAPRQSVYFTDRSLGGPTAWNWDFGDGATSTLRSPTHAYLQSGAYLVRLTATNAAGSTVKSQSVNVVSGVASPVTFQVPVVLDAFGVPPAHFTSDLVAVNRNGVASRVTLSFQPAPGTPGANGPRVPEAIDAGREFRIADVVAYLRGKGYSFPASGSTIVGTLRVTFEDVADATLVFAGSRTSTPNPSASIGGRFGLFATAPAVGAAAGDSVTVFGLREDAAFRSNLAFEDVPQASGAGSGSTFSIQLYDGDTGFAIGSPTSVSLGAAEWAQIGSVLAGKNIRNGYAKVTKTGGGASRFLAYGVVNDGPATGGGTSDGSFVEATPGAPGAAQVTNEALVPIVLRVTSGGVPFATELVLANPTTGAATATLTYVASAQLGGDGTPRSATVTIPAGRQIRKADAIAYLRDELKLPLPANGVNQGGALFVSGAVATARTFNPNPDTAVGGTFGLAYGAVAKPLWAASEAWIYGLVQDASTRSNVAVVDARRTGSGSVGYVAEVYDADAGDGTVPKGTLPVTLGPGQWFQFNQILSGFGVTHGYVRVRPASGTSSFVTYGILNDGAGPGQRTSDGSYVGMSAVR